MIYVECKPDKALVMSLGIPKKYIRHVGGKSNICKRLERGYGLKGLMDEDPLSTQPPYIKSLEVINELSNFKILHDPHRNNYVIMLSPRLEEWILKIAKEVNINVSNYGLPTNADDLHKVINVKLENFRKLLSDLRDRSKAIKDLERILKERL